MIGLAAMQDVYAIPVRDIQGRNIDLNQFKHQVLLIVNTASECGLKGQLAELQDLHAQFADKGLVILAAPSADFMGQEPRDGEALHTHCSLTYKSEYRFLERMHVRKSPVHPLYQFLHSQGAKTWLKGAPWWNFEKFLIFPEGKTILRFRPWVSPKSKQMITAIEEAIRQQKATF